MKQAMIFAAGLGTRLRPLTDTRPKALVSVGGRPLLWHVLSKLSAAGYERVVVNVHHLADQIEDYLRVNEFGLETLVSDERAQLLETGGGIKHARHLFDEDSPVLIHNVDILSNVDLDWLQRQHLSDEDAVLLVSRRRTKRYLLFDSAMRLMGWTNIETGEVKSPYPWLREADLTIDDDLKVNCPLSILNCQLNAYAFSGIHSLSPRLFPLMDRFPDRFSIIDFYLQTCHRARVYGCVKDDLRLMDVGKIETIDQAEAFLKEHK